MLQYIEDHEVVEAIRSGEPVEAQADFYRATEKYFPVLVVSGRGKFRMPSFGRKEEAEAMKDAQGFLCDLVAALPPVAPSLSTPEPNPIPNNHPAVWDLVVSDMQERDQSGQEKYGTRLQPHNGRDALVDAYQEALDLAVYLRQAIYERDGK